MNDLRHRYDRVTREDLVMFVNACFACNGQREFYRAPRGEAVSIEFLHEYTRVNYRRLYARTLAAGINHFNQQQIIANLLASGKDAAPEQRAEEGRLIAATLAQLPPQRAFRVMEMLRERRVNNRRTRAIVRDYLAGRPDPAFDAVKYRRKVRAAAVHAHLSLPGETGAFLFGGWKKRVFTTPIFESFRQACYSASAIYDLPYSIAEGFCVRHKIPRDEFLKKISGKMTAQEKLRLQDSAAREDLALEIDFSRFPPTKLALYLLSLPRAEKAQRRERFAEALATSARRVVERAPQRLGKVAAVLDASYSSSGSFEKRRRPLAVALAASQILAAASREYRAFWTPAPDDPLLVEAGGQTDLATPLLDALEWGAELVVIISDGWENDPPRGASEVARVFRRKIDPDRKVSLIHMNPVFDTDHYAPRNIGADIPTVGLRDAEDVLTALSFARFADGTAPLEELEAYLATRMERMFEAKR